MPFLPLIFFSFRVVNMELLQSFAPDVWLLYNRELEAFKGRLDKELEGLRKEAELVGNLFSCETKTHIIFELTSFSSFNVIKNRSTSAARPSKKSWPHAWPT